MRKKKDVCSYCGAGEEKPVEVTPLEVPGHVDMAMCLVCEEIGVSRYPNQNLQPVTRLDLSRAVRLILERK